MNDLQKSQDLYNGTMKMQRFDIVRIVLTPLLEMGAVALAFWIAYNIRNITDGIPFIQLKIPSISPEQFAPFVVAGIVIWLLVFARAKLYSDTRRPLFEEIRRVIAYSFFWFFVFIGFVYLTQGFLFHKEIPRLIIAYTLIIGAAFSILIRSALHGIGAYLHHHHLIARDRIAVLRLHSHDEIPFQADTNDAEYFFFESNNTKELESHIREQKIDAILLISGEWPENILSLARIYGIQCSHPRIMPNMRHFAREESFLGGIPVITLHTVSITAWERVFKRMIDILLSSMFLILSAPIMLVIYLGIKLEDRSWPAIYRNRRIGQDGKIFTLYKFRYMYWKYCTKEDYLDAGERDEWLEFEEQLKETSDTRHWPLYKIKDDPRKMKFGALIERFSLDELPQLFNVFLGNMSLVGPRPHQPREVALYDESDKQVLTIKPGITGMAQVYGRDKNTFKEEVMLDTYYIENYSLSLDIMIILRTILVVLSRPFEKKS